MLYSSGMDEKETQVITIDGIDFTFTNSFKMEDFEFNPIPQEPTKEELAIMAEWEKFSGDYD